MRVWALIAIGCLPLVVGCATGTRFVGGVEYVVVSHGPPARPYARVLPRARPGPTHVWVSGHYVWRDRYVWVEPRWVVPPRPKAAWVPGRYERDRGWRRPRWK